MSYGRGTGGIAESGDCSLLASWDASYMGITSRRERPAPTGRFVAVAFLMGALIMRSGQPGSITAERGPDSR